MSASKSKRNGIAKGSLWWLGAATGQAITALARAGAAVPFAHPRLHGVEVIRDIPYCTTDRRCHLLDVYRPIGASSTSPRPSVLYIHGGGFGILTKDSHWLLALIFARRGYTVFNISYRLAPAEPYPAAVEDACAAYEWIAKHGHEYGGDPKRLVLAGDSAGGNLVAALTLAACYKREEPFAKRVWDTGIVPKAVVPTSAIFQVSDAQRFARRRSMPRVVSWVLEGVGKAYLHSVNGTSLDFADPVCALERGIAPDRPLPPFFVGVGTLDPLLDDTRRLEAALRKLGSPIEARYYPNAMHVFHAAVWRRRARGYWKEAFEFLSRTVGSSTPSGKGQAP
ncbi:MAG: alpha/beta hydrolase [Kofleriaceae bacterium]